MALPKPSTRDDAAFESSEGIRLAYAENRYQNPADLFPLMYTEENYELSMYKFDWVANQPSYIAMADGAVITNILCLLAEAFRKCRGKVPFIAIAGKHANPCGMAFDWDSPFTALFKALLGNTVAIMGGEMVTNFPIDDKLGELLYAVPEAIATKPEQKWGLDLILAPEFSPATVELLGKKEKRRLMSNLSLLNPVLPTEEWTYRFLPGEILRQKTPNFILTPEAVIHWTGKPLSESDFETLLVAWAAAWRASSNSVALAKDNMLIGMGAGQQDRIECVRLCLSRAQRAGHKIEGAIFASDAFFPFAESNFEYNRVLNQAKETIRQLTYLFTTLISRNEIFSMANKVLALDNREGTELLADAGCLGGVVTWDGNNKEKVKEFFEKRKMSVGFVAPENRGFSKH